MSGLADTSVLVDYLRGSEPARALLTTALENGHVTAASMLTRIELSIGMRPHEQSRTDALVDAIRWLPLDRAVIEDADSLARRYGLAHSGIDVVDYCVAATARVHELELWTLNIRHFPMFVDLKAPW